ncbi:MAG: hypothetical protein LUQ66_00910 [Methanoregula sp.]|nr:hypothetical protein [Methanoregula sp.]
MDINELFSLGTLIGIAGFIFGFWQYLKSEKNQRKSEAFQEKSEKFQQKYEELYLKVRTITWDELEKASRDLRKKFEETGFRPNIIFTPCRRGASIANMMYGVDENIFLYVGLRIDERGKPKPSDLPLNDLNEEWEDVKTRKYHHYIPKFFLTDLNRNKKLLILDDFAMSGDSLKDIVTDLIEKKGFKKENIKTATIICTSVARDANKSPDFTVFDTEYSDFYFPWGKAV